MKNVVVMGIDPGLLGAVAFVNLDRSEASTHPMPIIDGRVDVVALSLLIEEKRKISEIRHCVIEEAIVLPKQGSVSGFGMGKNYGRLVAFLEMAGIPFEEIRPAKWKRSMFGTLSAEDKKKIKHVAVRHARALFPVLAKELLLSKDGLSEALLLAEVGRGQLLGVTR